MFRFTIRDVLWLTVVVALGAAWWVSHHAETAKRERLAARAVELRDCLVQAKEAYEQAISNFDDLFDAVSDVTNISWAQVESVPPDWSIISEPNDRRTQEAHDAAKTTTIEDVADVWKFVPVYSEDGIPINSGPPDGP